jgi:ribonuclease HI
MSSWILGIIGSILAAGFLALMGWAIKVISKENKRRFDLLEKKLDEVSESNKISYKAAILALDGLVQLGANGVVKKTRDEYIKYAIDN